MVHEQGPTIFQQLISFLPIANFAACVVSGLSSCRHTKTLLLLGKQFLATFAQLTSRSLRDIEACLCALGLKRYHWAFRTARWRVPSAYPRAPGGAPSWGRIFADFAQVLNCHRTTALCRRCDGRRSGSEPLRAGFDHHRSLPELFPWAKFRKHKGAVKMHTLLDLHGNIPTFIHITDGKVHDVNILDELPIEAGAFYVMDRGYVDFERLYRFTLNGSFFVTRTKANILLQRRYSHPVDTTTGVRSDHTVILTTRGSASLYPDALRRVTYCDPETGKRLKFLSNNFTLPALVIGQIYKKRWEVELFFRWIKMHCASRRFTEPARTRSRRRFGSPFRSITGRHRAQKTQSGASLYQLYRFSVLHFSRKRPFYRHFSQTTPKTSLYDSCNQLNLFDF